MQDQGIRRTLVHITSAFTALGIKGRATGYEQIAAGLIPRPVHVGRRAVIPSDEINALIDARVAGLDEAKLKTLVDQLHAKRGSGYGAVSQ